MQWGANIFLLLLDNILKAPIRLFFLNMLFSLERLKIMYNRVEKGDYKENEKYN